MTLQPLPGNSPFNSGNTQESTPTFNFVFDGSNILHGTKLQKTGFLAQDKLDLSGKEDAKTTKQKMAEKMIAFQETIDQKTQEASLRFLLMMQALVARGEMGNKIQKGMAKLSGNFINT